MEQSSPTTVIEQFKLFLVYYSDFSLLLCKKHKIGIFRNSLRAHIKEHLDELSISSSFYKEVINFFQLYTLSTPEDIHKRLQSIEKVKSFPELDIINSAFLCTFPNCKSISLSKKKMRVHYNTIHKSENTLLFKENIRIQTLLPSRFLFEVELNEDNPSPEDISNNSTSEDQYIDINDDTFELAKDDFMKQFDKTVENLEIRKKFVDFRNTNVEQNSFYIQTKYFDIINNQNTDVIYDLASNYEKVNDSFLRILSITLECLLLNISLKVSQFDRQHLNILNSFEYNKTIMKRFKVVQELASFRKYLKVIQRFLCFVFRVLDSESDYFVDIYKTDEDIDSIFNEIQSMKLKIDESSEEVLDLVTKRSILLKKDFISKRYSSIYNKDDQIDESSSGSSSDSDSELDSIDELSDIDRDEEESDENTSNISKEYKELLNKLETLLVRFITSFVKQSIRFNSFESLINIFFACLSVDNNNKSIKSSFQMSQYYSAFIYCIQLIVLRNCYYEYSNNSLNTPNTSMLSILHEFMNSYMKSVNIEEIRPMSEVLSLRAYCFSINKSSSTSSYQILVNSAEKITCNDVTMSIDNMKVLYSTIVSDAYDLLFKELLFDQSREKFDSITLDSAILAENFSDNSQGFNFILNNPNLKRYETFNRQLLFDNENLRKRFYRVVKSGSRPTILFRPNAVKQYIRNITEFLMKLMLLFHITSGLPSRVTELATTTFTNSLNTLKRNLIMDPNMKLFVFRLRYSKNLHNTLKESSAIKYLSQPVSYLVLIYLVVVSPFKSFLEIMFLKRKKAISSLLFDINGRVISSTQLSSLLKSYSIRLFATKINISLYRHLSLGFVRYIMKENIFNDPKQDENSLTLEIEAESMNHSISTHELHYSRNIFDFQNLRNNRQQLFLLFSLRFHSFFGLSSISLSNTQKIIDSQVSIPRSTINPNPANRILALKSTKKHNRSISTIDIESENEKRVKLVDIQRQIGLNT